MTERTSAAEQQRITLPDGSHLAAQLHGDTDAPAVLLIAGLAADHTTWGAFPAVLAGNFRVITYDHRGTGASDDSTANALTTRTLAQDASDLLAALHVDAAHVYGHSMGARVAQWLAIDHPDLVITLTLGAGTGGDRLGVPRPDEATRALSTGDPDAIARCALGPAVADDPAARRLLGTQQTSQQALTHHLAASSNHDAWDDLNRICAPTLILHGTADRMTPVENAHRLADAIPQATLHLLPGPEPGTATSSSPTTPRRPSATTPSADSPPPLRGTRQPPSSSAPSSGSTPGGSPQRRS